VVIALGLPGVTAVDDDVVTCGDEAPADLVHGGLEPAVAGRHASGAEHRDAHAVTAR
jgi:hypothetical protein